MASFELYLAEKVLEPIFQSKGEQLLQKWKIKRAIRKEAAAFSTHIIWNRMQKQGIDAEKIQSGFNHNMAHQMIQCYLEYDEPERESNLEQILEVWLYRSGTESEEGRAYATEAFQLFKNSLLKIRQKCLPENDQFLAAMISRSTSDIMQQYTDEIQQEIEHIDSIYNFVKNRNTPWATQSKNFLDYRSGQVPFCGRRGELETLWDFCDCDGDVRFWSVIAPGGSGKSRLALEFCKAIRGPEWDCLFLNHASLTKMLNVQKWKHPKNLLIVIDYVAMNAGAIGTWLCDLRAQKLDQKKIRILFLERNGFEADKAPLWYENMRSGFGGNGCMLEELRYAHATQFELPALSAKDKTRMITKAVQNNGSTITQPDADRMLAMLADIDPDGERPLYLLFIVKAYLDGEADWQHWSREELQQHIYQKERGRIKEIAGDVPACQERAQLLWAFATLSGPFDIADVQSIPMLLCDPAQLLESGLTETALRERMKAICGGSEHDVTPYVPDIAGEYFLLETLKTRHDIRALLTAAWAQNAFYTAATLDRLYTDYRGTMQYQHLFSFQEDSLLSVQPENNPGVLFYAMLMTNVSAAASSDTDDAEEALDILRALAEHHPKQSDFILTYANGLFNLSNKQNPEQAAGTIGLLRDLAEQYPKQSEIVLTYAKGLVNLSHKQDPAQAAATVGLLRALAEHHPKQSEIVLEYAKGLVNLSYHQDPAQAAATVGLLRALAEQHPKPGEIVLQYANGLVNLSNKQNPEQAAATVGLLRDLAEQYPKQGEIVLEYAKGLFNLSYDQAPTQAAKTVELLRALAEQHPKQDDIVLTYAQGLVNLSVDQNPAQAAATVELLRTLAESHPKQSEIVLQYANGLVNLSNKQNPEQAAATVGLLRALAEQYFKQGEIVLRYAKGLFNLSVDQDPAQAAATVGLLRDLAEQYPKQGEIVLEYAKGLTILSTKQSIPDAGITIKRIKQLTEQYEGQEELIKIYQLAQALLHKRQSPGE